MKNTITTLTFFLCFSIMAQQKIVKGIVLNEQNAAVTDTEITIGCYRFIRKV